MNLTKTIKDLCTPAYVYLVISIISIIIVFIQNRNNTDVYCVGSLECDVPSTPLVFVANIVYTVFWVFVLNSICKSGHSRVSWFLVLLPFVLFLLALGVLILIQTKTIEGHTNEKCDCEKGGKCTCGKN
jgi:hypothetical protein